MDRTLVEQAMDGNEAAFDALSNALATDLPASTQFGQAREESEIAEDR